MSLPDRRTLNVLTTALLFAVVLAIAYVARAVIVIFAIRTPGPLLQQQGVRRKNSGAILLK